jgi:hypothetical protein
MLCYEQFSCWPKNNWAKHKKLKWWNIDESMNIMVNTSRYSIGRVSEATWQKHTYMCIGFRPWQTFSCRVGIWWETMNMTWMWNWAHCLKSLAMQAYGLIPSFLKGPVLLSTNNAKHVHYLLAPPCKCHQSLNGRGGLQGMFEKTWICSHYHNLVPDSMTPPLCLDVDRVLLL